ncbi:MAG: iron-containing alcohol dehydrogenase [Clostridia bacterium]|nr:iron-containing alcohol dehydrogenase [Clostridia bacterium]
MLPKYYEFQNKVKICSGASALENIPYELRLLGASSPLPLSDEGLEKIGALKTVQSALTGVTPGAVFTAVPPDSSIETVNTVADVYKKHSCDSIIAVGGGSVIDTAKGARLVLASGSQNITELMGCECIANINDIPFIAVPTTSGTGSEATPIAVISNTQLKIKMEYVSSFLVPDVAVLDVRMTQTLPPRITASTGIDALCHAIEAYSCLQKNPVSDAFAASAIRLVAQNLKTAITKPADKDARLAMANAAALAGVSFGNSMVGLVHAIGHSLGAHCHVAHGDAMAILLPHVMRYNLSSCSDTYSELLLHLAEPNEYASCPAEKRAEKAVEKVEGLISFCHEKANLPHTLSETNRVSKDDFAAIARGAVNDGAILVNPASADENDIISILRSAY